MGLVAALILIAVVVVVGITGGMIWGINNPLGPGKETKAISGKDVTPKAIGTRKEPKRLMGEDGFSYLDVGTGTTRDEIVAVLEPRREDEVVGDSSGCIITALGRADFARDGIVTLMEREFGRESLTWDKFAAPVNAALNDIYENSARAANLIQVFDTNAYQRLLRLDKANQLVDGSQQANQLSAMRASLQEVHELVAANEGMLEELNRLQSELSKLSGSHQDGTSEEIAEEIRGLAEDTKQYV